VQYGVDGSFDVNVVRYIVMNKEEARMTGQMSNIVGTAGDQIIHRDHRMPFSQKAITQV
jgi:hypothetical protein